MGCVDAQSVADFYAHRQVLLEIGFGPGSAYDLYARLIARHLGNHIPGRPSIVPLNMPGADSLVLANSLANVAPKDGSVIGAVFERIGVEPLVDKPNTRYDGRDFAWLGSALKATDVCMIWHDTPAKTIEDVRRYETIIGTAGTSGSVLAPRLLNAMAHTRFKIVPGYSGNDLFLAMERGETQARCMSWGGLKAAKPEWLADKKVNVVVQLALQKHPELPAVPLVTDLVSRQDDLATLDFLYATEEMGRPFVGPPGIPPERVAALRQAFDDTMSDPEFLADARRSSPEISPIPGTRVQQIVESLYQTPQAVIARVEALRAAH
jgi:tripartite-type tricarboxylate transporter receptor subunit TctC